MVMGERFIAGGGHSTIGKGPQGGTQCGHTALPCSLGSPVECGYPLEDNNTTQRGADYIGAMEVLTRITTKLLA